jgi:predicted CopG family antitoxin
MKYLEELKKRDIEIATVIPGREELEKVEKAVKEKASAKSSRRTNKTL